MAEGKADNSSVLIIQALQVQRSGQCFELLKDMDSGYSQFVLGYFVPALTMPLFAASVAAKATRSASEMTSLMF